MAVTECDNDDIGQLVVTSCATKHDPRSYKFDRVFVINMAHCP